VIVYIIIIVIIIIVIIIIVIIIIIISCMAYYCKGTEYQKFRALAAITPRIPQLYV
jgi:hypothetical protein